MTSELDMQSLICDAVNDGGGFAIKMAHKFFIGVSDLLVKCKGYPAGFLEVKRIDLTNPDLRYIFKLDVTGPQQRFLMRASKAGMPTGIASFLQARQKGIRSLRLQILTLTEAEAHSWMSNTSIGYTKLGETSARYKNVRECVIKWLETCAQERKNHG